MNLSKYIEDRIIYFTWRDFFEYSNTVPCIQKVNSTVQDNDLLFPVYYGNGWVNVQACQPVNTSDIPIAEHF